LTTTVALRVGIVLQERYRQAFEIAGEMRFLADAKGHRLRSRQRESSIDRLLWPKVRFSGAFNSNKLC
jgi:hypothetical protein